ncbi:hypothetical protein [Streptomonospora wellingtoniae]|uniref:Uncharacterized protein n=1 Tax=Streptomonospora wellingtoniae TaxID=3075544 RepID=A0ABU2KUR4_9ACTN|nr:hypothetical protein [Streptomonospora sp. DSM 45055]MDT0302902.1 hypothetical protein [Streptomonospora sp. DSM 45055]
MSFRPRYSQDIRKTRKLMKSKELQALLVRVTESVGRPYAESISPHESGEYRSAFRVSGEVEADRAQARLENTSDHAVPVEIKHRVLARTVDRLEGTGG